MKRLEWLALHPLHFGERVFSSAENPCEYASNIGWMIPEESARQRIDSPAGSLSSFSDAPECTPAGH